MVLPCRVISPTRAAGKFSIMTVMLPFAIPFGGPTQMIPPGNAFAIAAGLLPIKTVWARGGGPRPRGGAPPEPKGKNLFP